MKASRLNFAKDLLTTALLVGFVGLAIFWLMPGIQTAELGFLKQGYIDEQRRIIRETVINAGDRVLRQHEAFIGLGMAPRDSRSLLLDDLGAERFGVNGYGYFFVYDLSGTIISHPVFPELVGRRLLDIQAPDGSNLGQVFQASLGGAASGYVSYVWTAPGRTEPELKTSYVLTLPELGWTLVTGFYPSDLEPSLSQFVALNRLTVRDIQASLVGLLGLSLIVLLGFSWVAHYRIKGIEVRLSQQVLNLGQYKLILDQASMVSRTDPNGAISYVNDKFTEVTGYTRKEAIGKKHNIERHPDTPLAAFREMWETISQGRVWDGVIKNQKADGTSYFKHATIVPLVDERGRIVEYLSSGQDVTFLIEGRRALEKAFVTDQLTGLGSRISLLADLEEKEDPCVALVDIEGFSSLNQTFGSTEGDSLLRQFASIVLDFCRSHGSTAYRIWADTFAILASATPESDFPAQVSSLAGRLGATELEMGGQKVPLIVHAGVSLQGRDSFLCADIALKKAKASRRMVCVFDPTEAEGTGDTLENLKVLSSIHSALEGDRIYPVFQPILDIRLGRVVKYECLMRIEDAEGSVIMPDSFIQISKKTNLYRHLTRTMIEKSIEAFRHTSFEFSINLTIEDLMNRETIDFLIEESGLKGVSHRLIAEIVETEELRDFEDASRSLALLRKAGMGIAVDDFGSGYSNFEYLLKLKPDYIKIDRVIIQNLLKDDRARDMLASIVSFAGKSQTKTIAEYVDSRELMDEVILQGIDFVQGWFVGKASRQL